MSALVFCARHIIIMHQTSVPAMPNFVGRSSTTSWNKPDNAEARQQPLPTTAMVDAMPLSADRVTDEKVKISPTSITNHPLVHSSDKIASQRIQNPITIVIELNGNMANQLCKLAYGYGLQFILQEDYGIVANTILRHQESSKWIGARKRVVTCFPRFREMDFSAGNTDEFKELIKKQKKQLLDATHRRSTIKAESDFFHLVMCKTEHCIRDRLDVVAQVLSNKTFLSSINHDPATSNFLPPFLRADTQADIGYIVDRYYDRLKGLFEFDYNHPDCCCSSNGTSNRAFANETVFHLRAFWGELPTHTRLSGGFEELSANKTIHELFLPRYDRDRDGIAILSRFPVRAKSYLETPMKEAGFRHVRFIDTEKGQQSFCFLMSGQRDLVGYSQSTFAVWVAYLGNATTARLYSLRSPERVALFGDDNFARYNHSNPTLKRKMLYELYNSEEQDQLDQQVGALASLS
jgi:hypothetical protein